MNATAGSRAAVTRDKIIAAAADEIHRSGFQAASIGQILKKLQISKGCFYHHFPTKNELGYAVVDELFAPAQLAAWDDALAQDDPLEALIGLLQCIAGDLTGNRLRCGCPINNLSIEMSPIDEGFRTRVEGFYRTWHRRLAAGLRRARDAGHLRPDAGADEVAAFIIATTQGAIGLAKNAQDSEVFARSIAGLVDYLRSLRP